MRSISAEEREVAGGSREPGHDEEVLVAPYQLRHGFVAVEEEFGRVDGRVHGFGGVDSGVASRNCRSRGEGRTMGRMDQKGLAPMSFWVSRTATACPAW